MNIRSATQQLAGPIGRDIGGADDITQAELLNGFFEFFFHSMQQGNDRLMQTAYVTQKLSPRAKQTILEFAEFCNEEAQK